MNGKGKFAQGIHGFMSVFTEKATTVFRKSNIQSTSPMLSQVFVHITSPTLRDVQTYTTEQRACGAPTGVYSPNERF